MTTPASEADVLARALYRRVVTGQSELAQIVFHAAVLDRYRENSQFQITRTDTIGSLRRAGGWKLDFGILAGDAQVHTSLGDLANLPESERNHWVEYVAPPSLSLNFIRTRLYAASCIDDGEVRRW